MYQCADTDTIPVLTAIAGRMNTILSCDNGYIKYSVGFVTLGSRIFNTSLVIINADILSGFLYSSVVIQN